MSDKPCTCHPDDNPPVPCPQKFALSECRAAVPLPHAVAIQMCSDFKESDQSCGDPNHSPESCTCLKLARAWRGMESDLAAARERIAKLEGENERLRVDANRKQPYVNGEIANRLETWRKLAFELSQSIVALSVVKDGVTFFQKDPIKDQETFHLWVRLNDAQTAVLDAYRRDHGEEA